MKALILYYSYGGNTREIAKRIQKEIDGDLAEIETVKPYEGSYSAVVDQGQREVNEGVMPEIKPLSVNFEDYDTIALGTPVWWYTFAPAIKTLLNVYPLTGKSVYPFVTNGGWIGHTFADIAEACPGAVVKKGLNIQFDGNTLKTPAKAVTSWARDITLDRD